MKKNKPFLGMGMTAHPPSPLLVPTPPACVFVSWGMSDLESWHPGLALSHPGCALGLLSCLVPLLWFYCGLFWGQGNGSSGPERTVWTLKSSMNVLDFGVQRWQLQAEGGGGGRKWWCGNWCQWWMRWEFWWVVGKWTWGCYFRNPEFWCLHI